MSSDRLDPTLARQLSLLVDGRLDEPEMARLEATLRRDPEAREIYRRYLATHLDLGDHFELQDVRPRIGPRRVLRWPLATAALLALTAGLLLWKGGRNETPEDPPTGPVLAVTARSEGARWNLPEPPSNGTRLRSGALRIDAGQLLLGLAGGQTLTLRAPTEIELLSETEMVIKRGEAALEMANSESPYIIRVPGGAVVDLGTAFSVKVDADGVSDVLVLDGRVNATTLDDAGRTRAERVLGAGETVRIHGELEASPVTADDFLRPLPPETLPPSPGGDLYARQVAASEPLVWWRFEPGDPDGSVPSATPGPPLEIRGNASLSGPLGRSFLRTDNRDSAGFAVPAEPIDGLGSTGGLTLECLFYSATKDYATLLALEDMSVPPPESGPFAHLDHHPQLIVLERMGRRGSKIGHLHPDFAIRGMMRVPPGYDGGSNTYSSESHLVHRWIHVAFTIEGARHQLYIDGRLSDLATTGQPFSGKLLRPIIGRLQPLPEGERRQWNGGIDEVALYPRALGPDEIVAHFRSLEAE